MIGIISVPSDPAAETIPSTLLRFFSETARAQAVMTNDEAVHDNATPISAPERISDGGTVGRRHDQKPDDIDHRAGQHRDAQPEPVGERPDRGLRQAPDDILDRNGQG